MGVDSPFRGPTVDSCATFSAIGAETLNTVTTTHPGTRRLSTPPTLSNADGSPIADGGRFTFDVAPWISFRIIPGHLWLLGNNHVHWRRTPATDTQPARSWPALACQCGHTAFDPQLRLSLSTLSRHTPAPGRCRCPHTPAAPAHPPLAPLAAMAPVDKWGFPHGDLHCTPSPDCPTCILCQRALRPPKSTHAPTRVGALLSLDTKELVLTDGRGYWHALSEAVSGFTIIRHTTDKSGNTLITVVDTLVRQMATALGSVNSWDPQSTTLLVDPAFTKHLRTHTQATHALQDVVRRARESHVPRSEGIFSHLGSILRRLHTGFPNPQDRWTMATIIHNNTPRSSVSSNGSKDGSTPPTLITPAHILYGKAWLPDSPTVTPAQRAQLCLETPSASLPKLRHHALTCAVAATGRYASSKKPQYAGGSRKGMNTPQVGDRVAILLPERDRHKMAPPRVPGTILQDLGHNQWLTREDSSHRTTPCIAWQLKLLSRPDPTGATATFEHVPPPEEWYQPADDAPNPPDTDSSDGAPDQPTTAPAAQPPAHPPADARPQTTAGLEWVVFRIPGAWKCHAINTSTNRYLCKPNGNNARKSGRTDHPMIGITMCPDCLSNLPPSPAQPSPGTCGFATPASSSGESNPPDGTTAAIAPETTSGEGPPTALSTWSRVAQLSSTIFQAYRPTPAPDIPQDRQDHPDNQPSPRCPDAPPDPPPRSPSARTDSSSPWPPTPPSDGDSPPTAGTVHPTAPPAPSTRQPRDRQAPARYQAHDGSSLTQPTTSRAVVLVADLPLVAALTPEERNLAALGIQQWDTVQDSPISYTNLVNRLRNAPHDETDLVHSLEQGLDAWITDEACEALTKKPPKETHRTLTSGWQIATKNMRFKSRLVARDLKKTAPANGPPVTTQGVHPATLRIQQAVFLGAHARAVAHKLPQANHTAVATALDRLRTSQKLKDDPGGQLQADIARLATYPHHFVLAHLDLKDAYMQIPANIAKEVRGDTTKRLALQIPKATVERFGCAPWLDITDKCGWGVRTSSRALLLFWMRVVGPLDYWHHPDRAAHHFLLTKAITPKRRARLGIPEGTAAPLIAACFAVHGDDVQIGGLPSVILELLTAAFSAEGARQDMAMELKFVWPGDTATFCGRDYTLAHDFSHIACVTALPDNRDDTLLLRENLTNTREVAGNWQWQQDPLSHALIVNLPRLPGPIPDAKTASPLSANVLDDVRRWNHLSRLLAPATSTSSILPWIVYPLPLGEPWQHTTYTDSSDNSDSCGKASWFALSVIHPASDPTRGVTYNTTGRRHARSSVRTIQTGEAFAVEYACSDSMETRECLEGLLRETQTPMTLHILNDNATNIAALDALYSVSGMQPRDRSIRLIREWLLPGNGISSISHQQGDTMPVDPGTKPWQHVSPLTVAVLAAAQLGIPPAEGLRLSRATANRDGHPWLEAIPHAPPSLAHLISNLPKPAPPKTKPRPHQ
jgi:hypothetical protein